MQKFTTLTGTAAPLVLPNIDTDVIIPSREMKGVGKTGLSSGMFANWRYTDAVKRIENPDFILNRASYRGAPILIAGKNFGCGSSREHAVWAMAEYGFRAVLAPSFGAIFYGNCVRNGILPVVLPEELVTMLADKVAENPDKNKIAIDLPRQTVGIDDGAVHVFSIPKADKTMLVEGLDSVDLTLRRVADIDAFEQGDRNTRPWVYAPSIQ
jgi:3-isopropylmalate/(R)-2-methylmalate dehydratase small subunit